MELPSRLSILREDGHQQQQLKQHHLVSMLLLLHQEKLMHACIHGHGAMLLAFGTAEARSMGIKLECIPEVMLRPHEEPTYPLVMVTADVPIQYHLLHVQLSRGKSLPPPVHDQVRKARLYPGSCS